MLRPLYHIASVVVLNSRFCVVQGLVELLKVGVFAAALIKKRRYWPKYVEGEKIKEHFESKPVGFADALPGTMDGVPFHISCQKAPNYVMMFMTTYGTLNGKGKENRRGANTFQYTDVVANHYQY